MAADQDIAELNGHAPVGLTAEEEAAEAEYERGRQAYYAGKEWLRSLDPVEAEILAKDAMADGCVDPFVLLLSLEPDDVAWLVGRAFASCHGQCREMVIGENACWPGRPCPRHVAEA